MGAWGTSLYANDTTCDIRGDYVDKLRRGKSNEETTKELISQNEDIMGDLEEEPLFWYALADTQWNYGRLLPEVKERALYFLEQGEELERWRESGEKKLNSWMKTLADLKEKLNSPMPEEKKVSKYRIYKCAWKLGDVFAYQFTSDYSREKGLYGNYVVFRKVSEASWWPGHIIPVVQVYKWIWKEIPTLDEAIEKELLILSHLPITLKYKPNKKPGYYINLITESKRMLPKSNLTFLGNVDGSDLVEFQGYNYLTGYPNVGWEGKGYNNSFEKYTIDTYLAWKEVE